jgi:energy-coupling factor transporter ATP-binding protein EcfA2
MGTGLLGERLTKKKKITKEQLREALERQRIHGGRLGGNMVALGIIDEEDLSSFFMSTPEVPVKVEDTGLSSTFIIDLIIKHALNLREFTLPEIAIQTRFDLSILDEAIEKLRRDRIMEVKSTGQLSKRSYVFALTDAGKKKATDLLEVSRYVGPAPVPFEEYKSMVEIQTIKSILVDEKSIHDAFGNIIVSDNIMKRLGPAVSSGKAIFLYGPPGNGKTTIAETIGKVLPGKIYIPYAVIVEGEIITIYDKASHEAVEPELGPDEVDQRWILVKRPVVMVGGEMTLKGLDLDFNPIAKFYEAPLQMKSNNGLFIVDDFGRQQMDPQDLLNRWIVPLERRTDFLTFQTGMKIEIPFDQLVIFSTNLEPKNLVDEAFLRRIRYKIKIDHPALHEYREIFQRVCQSNSIAFSEEAFEFLVENYYKKNNVKLNACHCRDIIDNIIDDAHYHGVKPELTKDTISSSWESYFVEM